MDENQTRAACPRSSTAPRRGEEETGRRPDGGEAKVYSMVLLQARKLPRQRCRSRVILTGCTIPAMVLPPSNPSRAEAKGSHRILAWGEILLVLALTLTGVGIWRSVEHFAELPSEVDPRIFEREQDLPVLSGAGCRRIRVARDSEAARHSRARSRALALQLALLPPGNPPIGGGTPNKTDEGAGELRRVEALANAWRKQLTIRSELLKAKLEGLEDDLAARSRQASKTQEEAGKSTAVRAKPAAGISAVFCVLVYLVAAAALCPPQRRLTAKPGVLFAMSVGCWRRSSLSISWDSKR